MPWILTLLSVACWPQEISAIYHKGPWEGDNERTKGQHWAVLMSWVIWPSLSLTPEPQQSQEERNGKIREPENTEEWFVLVFRLLLPRDSNSKPQGSTWEVHLEGTIPWVFVKNYLLDIKWVVKLDTIYPQLPSERQIPLLAQVPRRECCALERLTSGFLPALLSQSAM